MKILTLNTWQERGPWQERWEVTLEGLERFRPDFVAFQELFSRPWAHEVQKRSGYRTLVFPQENCGLAVLTACEVSGWGVVLLPQSPVEEYSRYALWVETRVKGRKVYFFNTHLSWKLEDGETRQKQVKELVSLVREKAGEHEAVLVGDLNSPPNSPEIKTLIKEGKFRDLYHEKHPWEKGCTWDHRNPYVAGAEHEMPDRRIDYVLARGREEILKVLSSCELVFTEPTPKGIWASDHYGLLAQFG